MADIEIRRLHHMAHAAARQAAERMADKLAGKFGLRGDWDGDTMRFQGTGVTGTLTVGPKDLHIVATLGLLLKAMKGSIEGAVRSELDSILPEPAAKKPAPKGKKASPSPKKGR
jgi:putative polyhydroxyalkanoate system protein